MDKQMIEEMAKIIDIDCGECYTCDYYDKYDKGLSANCTCFLQARELYNAGYRKIHENAVVLMGTETEQRFEDLMVAFDEMGFMPNTTHPFPEEYVETWKQRLIFVFGQLRKETAEKFTEAMRDCYPPRTDPACTVDDRYMLDRIDEICKEITEE